MAEAAPGHFSLGLGTSSNVIVERWNGIPFDKPYARVRDTLRFLRAALAGEKVTAGVRDVLGQGLPARTPARRRCRRCWSPRLRPGMLRLAGREGDGVILNWLVGGRRADRAQRGGRWREAPARAETKDVVARIFVLPSEDEGYVREVGRRMIASYLTVPVYTAFHQWLGRGEMIAPLLEKWAAGDRKGALETIPDELVDDSDRARLAAGLPRAPGALRRGRDQDAGDGADPGRLRAARHAARARAGLMYVPRPDQAARATSEWRAFLRRHPFGQLVAAGRGRDVPVISPTPFVLEPDDTRAPAPRDAQPDLGRDRGEPAGRAGRHRRRRPHPGAVEGDRRRGSGARRPDPVLRRRAADRAGRAARRRRTRRPRSCAAPIDAFEIADDLVDPQEHASKLPGIRAARLHPAARRRQVQVRRQRRRGPSARRRRAAGRARRAGRPRGPAGAA